MTNNWGDYCTYCGLAMTGEFPRKCANGHYTYASPVTVAVALQPVRSGDRIGLLAVQRGIDPYKGRLALPGGFADNGETAIVAAPRELSEETPIKSLLGEAVYFSEATGGSHNPKDPRSHAMYFYEVPVLNENEIDFTFHETEVQKLHLVFLANDQLQSANGENIELCFSTHHAAALKFLQSIPLSLGRGQG